MQTKKARISCKKGGPQQEEMQSYFKTTSAIQPRSNGQKLSHQIRRAPYMAILINPSVRGKKKTLLRINKHNASSATVPPSAQAIRDAYILVPKKRVS